MAVTHFLDLTLGSVKLYSAPYERSLVTILNPSNTNDLEKQVRLEIIEEFVYPNCEYTRIKINDITVNTVFNLNEYYVKNNTFSLKSLPGTPESAPVDCTKQYIVNTAYEPPEWELQKIDQVYFNSRDLKYVVAVSTPYTFLTNERTNQQQFETFCKKKGIRLIFDYLSKKYTQPDINRYLNYFTFANIEDYNVSFTRGGRIKALVSVHVKYLDAIPARPIEELVGNITEVIKVSTLDLGLIVRTLATPDPAPSLFNYYHKNTTLIGSVKFSDNFNFEKEGKNLIEFFNKTVDLVLQSESSFSTTRMDDYIEYALDSCKNIVFMSYYDSQLKLCTRIEAGILELNEMLKEHRYNSIYYLRDIKTIYYINPCDLDFEQFIAKFTFAKPTITKNVSMLEDLINQFLNSTSDAIIGILKDSITVANQMAIEQDKKEQTFAAELLGISKQIQEKRKKLKAFRNRSKKESSKSKYGDTIPTNVSQRAAYNNLSVREQQEFEKIEKELEELLLKVEEKRSELTFAQKIDVDTDPIKRSFMNKVNALNNEITKEFVGNNNSNPNKIDIVADTKKQAKDASNPKSKKDTKKTSISEDKDTFSLEWNSKVQKLYDTMRDTSFCRLTEVILKCLSILLDNLDANIKIGTRKVFTYKEFKDIILPSLTPQQKTIFYNIFITESCINKKVIIDIFTKVTGAESARALNNLSYQEAKRELINNLV